MITSEKEFKEIQKRVYDLMNKGEGNLSQFEINEVITLGKDAQEYERKLHPIEQPKTLVGMIELGMYEHRLNQAELAKRLKLSQTKLSLILNGKQKPDIKFLKGIHKELKIDAEFILEHA